MMITLLVISLLTLLTLLLIIALIILDIAVAGGRRMEDAGNEDGGCRE